MQQKWTYRTGARKPKNLPTQIVGEELERIRETHGGRLYPKAVVMEARPETAPLHPAFEWDDEVAGEKWREHQARNLIRSVRVVVEDGKDEPGFVHVPVTVADEGEPKGYYQSTQVVVENVDEFAAALTALMEKMQAAERAALELKRLADRAAPDDADRLAVITLAVEALGTAKAALKNLHAH